MALISGIPPQVWAEEGERAIVTALAILKENKPAPETRKEAPEGWELR